jgi:hypothetical protein
VATWEDVRLIALDLPEAVEDTSCNTVAWRIGTKAFAWERFLRRSEREQLGELAPEGPALGVRVADPGVVASMVAARPTVYLAVAGYGVHPMALLHVENASFDDLDEAITEGWLERAPRRLTRPFLAAAGGGAAED